MQISKESTGKGTLNVTVKIEDESVYKYEGLFVDTITDEAIERALLRCTDNDRIRRQRKADRKAQLAAQKAEVSE